MALNISEIAEPIEVDLTPYGLALDVRRTELLGGSGYHTTRILWTPTDTITLPPMGAAFWEIVAL